jgi:hypothetical protein
MSFRLLLLTSFLVFVLGGSVAFAQHEECIYQVVTLDEQPCSAAAGECLPHECEGSYVTSLCEPTGSMACLSPCGTGDRCCNRWHNDCAYRPPDGCDGGVGPEGKMRKSPIPSEDDKFLLTDELILLPTPCGGYKTADAVVSDRAVYLIPSKEAKLPGRTVIVSRTGE